MNKRFSVSDILKPVAVLLAVCIAAAALLALTDHVTRARIEAADAQKKADSMAVVLPDAAGFGEETADGDITYSPALGADGAVTGYALSVTVQGYGGEIDVMVGILSDGTISEATILAADDETPGLGQNTKKESFIGQFAGKSGILNVVKNAVSGDDEIQAVTSATISSRAVTKAVNLCTEYFENNLKGGDGNG